MNCLMEGPVLVEGLPPPLNPALNEIMTCRPKIIGYL